MAVAIRLRREGNRNRAFYRIVVADSRARRDGRFIETIGTYNPNEEGTNFRVNLELADDWISKGAQPSDTVRSIIKKARKAGGDAVITKTAAPAAEAATPAAEPAPAAEPEPAPAAEAAAEAEG